MLKILKTHASKIRRISKEDVLKFTELSGDTNPIHFGSDRYKGIVHGAFLNALVSGVIGTEVPGPGSVVVSQNLHFPSKCYVGDDVHITVDLVEDRKILTVKFVLEVPLRNVTVLYGSARLVMPKS